MPTIELILPQLPTELEGYQLEENFIIVPESIEFDPDAPLDPARLLKFSDSILDPSTDTSTEEDPIYSEAE